LSDTFFVSEWKPFRIFTKVRVRAAYLSSVSYNEKKAPVMWIIFRFFITYRF